MLKYSSQKQLGWTILGACGLGLLLFYVTTFALASSPESKYAKTLSLNDKLVIKTSACNLQIPTQTDTKMIVRCVASSNAEKISRQETKSVIQLAATDRLKVNANGCRLQVMKNTAARVVIKCLALPSQTNTPTATVTATLTPTPTSTTTTNWLARVNYYREMANLPHVTENATWSNGDYLHSRYMVKNDYIGHTEDTNNPWYTAAGKAAAENSNLMVSSSVNMSDVSAIDGWMGAPFHAVGIIDPALNQVGYGSYREADGGWQTGAGLDVIRGLGNIPGTVTFPVKFPSDNKTVALTSYSGNEYPNPLTSCAGYAVPTGLPLILQIGSGNVTPNVTAHSFQQGATALEHCVFDETNYTNPNSSEQSLVRSILNTRDAIILIPRHPLQAGKTYTVSITTNGSTHTWSFSVANSAAPAPSELAREIR